MSSYCERFFNEPLNIVPHEPYRWMQDLWYREPCKTSLVQIMPNTHESLVPHTETDYCYRLAKAMSNISQAHSMYTWHNTGVIGISAK